MEDHLDFTSQLGEGLNEDDLFPTPPETIVALEAYIAAKTGATPKLVNEILTELAAVACERIARHPNRHFLLPGIGNMLAVHMPPRKVNPFINKTASLPGTIKLKFHYSREAKDKILSLAPEP